MYGGVRATGMQALALKLLCTYCPLLNKQYCYCPQGFSDKFLISLSISKLALQLDGRAPDDSFI